MANEKKHFNVKVTALLLAVMLTIGGVVGGTVAWLIATPDPVVNTFTYGDINIELGETDTELDNDGKATTNQYKMMPGKTITKDPVITVKSGSEEMWLFVKLEKSGGAAVGGTEYTFDDYLDYEVDSSWKKLEGVENVWYYPDKVEGAADEDMKIHVIAGDKVTVHEEVTKEMLNALEPSDSEPTYPKLTVTAYAVQAAGNETAADAWEKVDESHTSVNP